MTRDQLLKPGEYASLPKSMLADPDISPGAKLVLMVLIDHLGQANASAWPGPARIAKLTALTRRGVQKAIDQLMAAGVVSKLGLSPKGTNDLVVNELRQRTECASEQSALRTQCASEQSALGVANDVRYPPRTECATPSAQSAPELLNRTTEEKQPKRTTGGQAAGAATPPSHALPTQSQADVPTAPVASRKQKGLTDAQKDAIASDRSGVALAAYLLHGGGAIGLPRESWKSVPPTPTHWAPRTGDTTRPDPDCSTTGLAGYIAYKLAAARVADGQNLKLPDISKLCGVVKKLRTRMTQDAIVGHIDRICANWPAIKSALSWMATPPPLDELLLHNRHVIEQSDRLAAGLTPTTNTQRSVSPISTREDFIRARKEGKYAKFYANQPGYADAA